MVATKILYSDRILNNSSNYLAVNSELAMRFNSRKDIAVYWFADFFGFE